MSASPFHDLKLEKLFPPSKALLVEAAPPRPAVEERRLFIVDEDGGHRPQPLAQGPFDSLHGGVIGGLLANKAEALAAEHGLGTPIAAHIQFLRPIKAEHRLTATAEIAVPGRRLNLVDAFIEADDGLRAEARFTFARDLPAPVPVEQAPAPALIHPDHLPEIVPPLMPPDPWFKDALEWRSDGTTVWMRPRVELGPPGHILPRIIATADWAAGISRPDGWSRPKVMGFPNSAITINLWRRPVGEWIGLTPSSRWNAGGFGLAQGAISDEAGDLGHAVLPVILLPFPERQKSAPTA
ncbi:thioesterase family protein [Zavarzinia compransoris]|uniref:Thioesterase family protein n=1 Tax=Zavarzinia compransoris TaxID=1264899 RepID=A0A317E6M6_9PROT|nr:thioesterase family protein [Zavarzinia compransoris]PWR21934.1 hypothetical protein DKG75_08105 [Zavarzinia compransoris]TDP47331.1 thioesterase superfamily protein [Zavarzinia compransoris]